MDSAITALLRSLNVAKSNISEVEKLIGQDAQLTEDHVRCIQMQYNQLLSSITCIEQIVGELYQHGKLTELELDDLQTSTPLRACEMLLNLIIQKSRDVYECFLESVKNTEQNHVYQILTSAVFDIDLQCIAEHSRAIRQHFTSLIDNITPEPLLSHLFQMKVLTSREYEDISSRTGVSKSNEALLLLISRKSSDLFVKFKEALSKTDQEHVVVILSELPRKEEYQIKQMESRKSSSLPNDNEKTRSRNKPKPFPKPAKILDNLSPASLRNSRKRRSTFGLNKRLEKLEDRLQVDVSLKVVSSDKGQLDSRIDIRNNCLQKILQESFDVKRKMVDIEENVSQATVENQELKTIIDQIQMELNLVNTKLAEETHMKKKAEYEGKQERQMILNERLEFRQRTEKLEDELKAAKDENTKLKTLVKATESKHEKQMQSELMTFNTKFDKEKRLRQEAESERSRVRDEMLSENFALKQQTKNLEDELMDAKNEISKLTTAAGSKNGHVEQMQSELISLNMKLVEESRLRKDAELEREQQKEAILTERLDYKEKTESMEQELWEAKNEIKKLETKLKDVENECKELRETSQQIHESDSLRRDDNPSSIATGETVLFEADENTSSLYEEIVDVAIYNNGIYTIRRQHPSSVDVYDAKTFIFIRRWKTADAIKHLEASKDDIYLVILCPKLAFHTVYVVYASGNILNKWETIRSEWESFSVTHENTLVLFASGVITEYSFDGNMIRLNKIELPGKDFQNLSQCIKLSEDHYVTRFGEHSPNKLGVLEMKVKKSNLTEVKVLYNYGSTLGRLAGKVPVPVDFAVDKQGSIYVVSEDSNKILICDSKLKKIGELFSEAQSFYKPRKLLLDESGDRLFVIDSTGIIIYYDIKAQYMSNVHRNIVHRKLGFDFKPVPMPVHYQGPPRSIYDSAR